MIEYKTGDILAEEVEALVNTVNCVGIMGRGIALQFKKAWPENFKAYAAADRNEIRDLSHHPLEKPRLGLAPPTSAMPARSLALQLTFRVQTGYYMPLIYTIRQVAWANRRPCRYASIKGIYSPGTARRFKCGSQNSLLLILYFPLTTLCACSNRHGGDRVRWSV